VPERQPAGPIEKRSFVNPFGLMSAAGLQLQSWSKLEGQSFQVTVTVFSSWSRLLTECVREGEGGGEREGKFECGVRLRVSMYDREGERQ
jgi:hypothetical protein